MRLEDQDHLSKLIFDVRAGERMPAVLAEYVVGVGVIAPPTGAQPARIRAASKR